MGAITGTAHHQFSSRKSAKNRSKKPKKPPKPLHLWREIAEKPDAIFIITLRTIFRDYFLSRINPESRRYVPIQAKNIYKVLTIM